MEFDKSFFEDEIRDGFYVTAEMKHAWAAQLEVLNDVDKVCRENGIQYFAEWGTLLGAVRHHGFIPWDDDLDICMKRPDYDKFVQIAEKAMPGYKIFNIYSDSDSDNMLTRIINGRTINFEREHLEKYHGFPYVSGLDIFPLDFIAPDKSDDDFQCEVIGTISFVSEFIRQVQNNKMELDEENIAELNLRIDQIEKMCGVTIHRDKDLAQQMNILMDRLSALYREDEAKYITIMTLWTSQRQYKFPKEYYAKEVRLPFENITIPVPYSYDAILKGKYGDYMKLVHTWDSHDYPFYAKQKDVLREKTGTEFNKFCDNINDIKLFKQNIAILRDKRKALRMVDGVSAKKNVVFMPFKPEHWDTMDGLWREYSTRQDVNIMVVQLPYYYKNLDGTVELYKTEAKYPDYIHVLTDREYDYETENPDEIIIQNPYDGYNIAASVDSRYYVMKLLMHTDKLIYVPYFVTEEIDEHDMRADVAMNSYVIMPGVVYADEVMLQSDNIRNLYIRKLTSFFGEDSRELWEKQLNSHGAKYLVKDNNNPLRYNRMPEKWRKLSLRNDGSYKKIILYYISTNSVLEHNEGIFEKIKRTMDVFDQYKDDVLCLIAFEGNMKDVLEKENSEFLTDYQCAVRKYSQYLVGNTELKEAVKACDAFYGEAGAEAQMCRNAGKPVMIENVNL